MSILFKFLSVMLTFPMLYVAMDTNLVIKKDLKILIVGNSILKNEPAPEIGWNGNWGMAAKTENADFLHIYKNLLERTKRYNSVDIKFKNISTWENDFNYDLHQYDDFKSNDYDILVIRLGENVTNNSKYYLALNKMINYFKTKDTKVIITGIIWENGEKESIQKKVAVDNGYHYIPFKVFRANSANFAYGLYSNKLVAAHPSDTGMLLIAQLLFNKTIDIE